MSGDCRKHAAESRQLLSRLLTKVLPRDPQPFIAVRSWPKAGSISFAIVQQQRPQPHGINGKGPGVNFPVDRQSNADRRIITISGSANLHVLGVYAKRRSAFDVCFVAAQAAEGDMLEDWFAIALQGQVDSRRCSAHAVRGWCQLISRDLILDPAGSAFASQPHRIEQASRVQLFPLRIQAGRGSRISKRLVIVNRDVFEAKFAGTGCAGDLHEFLSFICRCNARKRGNRHDHKAL
jgi:hypothetical protein